MIIKQFGISLYDVEYKMQFCKILAHEGQKTTVSLSNWKLIEFRDRISLVVGKYYIFFKTYFAIL